MEVDSNGEPIPVFGQDEEMAAADQPALQGLASIAAAHGGFNLEESTQRALYFNNRKQKVTVPVVTRTDKSRAAKKPKKKVEELSLDCVKEKIFEVETLYEEAIKPFNLSWGSLRRRQNTLNLLFEATTEV